MLSRGCWSLPQVQERVFLRRLARRQYLVGAHDGEDGLAQMQKQEASGHLSDDVDLLSHPSHYVILQNVCYPKKGMVFLTKLSPWEA